MGLIVSNILMIIDIAKGNSENVETIKNNQGKMLNSVKTDKRNNTQNKPVNDYKFEKSLEKLDIMKTKGIISQEEYNQYRKVLIEEELRK